ncbi:MAG: helix-turn-helix domain-containing protein [Candidatus Bathyarchaeia archaeon]
MEASFLEAIKEVLAKKIAGEIVFSPNPSFMFRKWREAFGCSEANLAKRLGTRPSVISDYETGRRQSPGAAFIRRFIEALISFDEERGGMRIMEFARLMSNLPDAILDMKEFATPVSASKLCEAVMGVVVAYPKGLNRLVYGYTVADSIKAILTLSGSDFLRLIGSTTERALILTRVTHGRSPMVAVRVHPLKPCMVVLHGLREEEVDRELAVKIAEFERIPLIVSKAPSIDKIIEALRGLG